MLVGIIVIFIIGYLGIAFEHLIRIDKTAIALLTGVLCWACYALNTDAAVFLPELSHHLAGVAEILFFLLGAMVVVELMDAHGSFDLITDRISTRDPRTLLWIISILAFFLSALLDNLTAAIVMVSLLRKLVSDPGVRRLMVGVIVIAANAGGAWSPIGDVTTTMLWIGGQITAENIIKTLFLPSLVCAAVPVLCLSLSKTLRNAPTAAMPVAEIVSPRDHLERRIMMAVGLSGLLFVPVFKAVTKLPPYMGMILVLGVIWVVSEVLHRKKDHDDRLPLTASYALSRIDSPSILFFLGILLAVGSLEVTHLLPNLARWLDQSVGNQSLIVLLIGLSSAVLDNVPLVAATMGMYDLNTYPTDDFLWEFLSYCSGTGGSILIIGSAAGVAVMGMERIDFVWYVKKISFLALLGYLAGAGVYLLVRG